MRGCLSDQLIGQWWAHQLDLGHLLPVDHVRSALRAVLKYNLRNGFRDFEHDFRVYADGDDAGLLMCTWPHGDRPAVPTRYADEVWTGIEYQVAAHCLWEGMHDEAWAILRALWGRYDGRKRNPYNEIECGDHYARAMAGWTVVDALSGFCQDTSSGQVTLRIPQVDSALPYLSSTGWGLISRRGSVLEIDCRGGDLTVHRLTVENTDGRAVRVIGDGGGPAPAVTEQLGRDRPPWQAAAHRGRRPNPAGPRLTRHLPHRRPWWSSVWLRGVTVRRVTSGRAEWFCRRRSR